MPTNNSMNSTATQFSFGSATSFGQGQRAVPATTTLPNKVAMTAQMREKAPRILLVDDEPINIKVVRKYLANAGFTEFYSTTNASEVLPLIIRTEPDVILLDIVMPQFN